MPVTDAAPLERNLAVGKAVKVQHACRATWAIPFGNRAPGASIAEQTRDILARIDEFLAEAGSDKSRLLSATIWITDMRDFAEMNEV